MKITPHPGNEELVAPLRRTINVL